VALHLVYMVYTKLLHTNRGWGGLLETPNTPLKNVQIQGIAIEKNSTLNCSITTNLIKQLRSSMLVCFLKCFTQNLVRLWLLQIQWCSYNG